MDRFAYEYAHSPLTFRFILLYDIRVNSFPNLLIWEEAESMWIGLLDLHMSMPTFFCIPESGVPMGIRYPCG